MDVSVLTVVLILAAIALCAAGVWMLIEAARASRSVRLLADELGETLPSLVEKVDVTVDAMNAELLRVDGIVTNFEELSERVHATTDAVHRVVDIPVEVANEVGVRIRRAISSAGKSAKQ
jgi:uncharacterized protein YoxC